MSILNVRLFGKFCVEHDMQPYEGLRASKVQELFCYLLLNRDRTHHREALAALLWGDSSTAQSKKYLRQSLWQLQSALGACTRCSKQCLLSVEPDWVCLNSQAELWLDVAVFEEAFALAHSTRGQELEESQVSALQFAVNLYKGDLLEGWYQDWCLFERERLQNAYLSMLDKLMGFYEAHTEYEQGVLYGERILRIDRAREQTHQQLMRLRYHAGFRSDALRQYEHCVAALKEELGVGPSETTVALYEQIRAARLETTLSAPQVPAPRSQSPKLPQVLVHLEALCSDIARLEQQVKQDIMILEDLLKE